MSGFGEPDSKERIYSSFASSLIPRADHSASSLQISQNHHAPQGAQPQTIVRRTQNEDPIRRHQPTATHHSIQHNRVNGDQDWTSSAYPATGNSASHAFTSVNDAYATQSSQNASLPPFDIPAPTARFRRRYPVPVNAGSYGSIPTGGSSSGSRTFSNDHYRSGSSLYSLDIPSREPETRSRTFVEVFVRPDFGSRSFDRSTPPKDVTGVSFRRLEDAVASQLPIYRALPPALAQNPAFAHSPGFENHYQNRNSIIYNSPNYKGNAMHPGNQSAPIPVEDSCSVWITNLNLPDMNVAYHQLLDAVRGCGKVFACVINPPEENKNISTSAAKLVFFDPAGAKRLTDRAAHGHFCVNGYFPVVVPNRIKVAAQRPGKETRVIHIEGPKGILDPSALMDRFDQHFKYDIDDIIVLSETSTHLRVAWLFGSYRCQAAKAMSLLKMWKREAMMGEGEDWQHWMCVVAYYAPDPCEPWPGLSA